MAAGWLPLKHVALQQNGEVLDRLMNYELPEVTSGAEDDALVDLNYAMSTHHCDVNGFLHFEARGLHNGGRLGFSVVVDPVWKKQPVPNTGGDFYWGTTTLQSIGEESDALLAVLNSLYGTDLTELAIRDETVCTAVGLNCDPSTAAQHPIKMKLFIEDTASKLEGELFLNFEISKRRVELHEKDPGYRHPIVTGLARQ